MTNFAATRSLTLSIEAAIAGGSIVLTENGTYLGEWIGKSDRPRSEEILERVSDLLRASGRRVGDIGIFAVSAGPGSFTGIRIGMSTAMGLASGSGKQLAAVNLFEAISFSSGVDHPHLIYLPMGRSKAVAYLFEGSNRFHENGWPVVVEREDLKGLSSSKDPQTTHLFHSSLAEHFQGCIRAHDIGHNMAHAISKYVYTLGFLTTGPLFVGGTIS
ncbi:MAG: tRNA (adenosine(37)-N6)-threonylcarbamoyltransferase complex dimerization subunit type 1 TsaB [Acidobacteriota bacterium]|nr:MAG: tRNA (adenosine(37)-N6)-threonylcarbamoyltransferase complex dimerization subunit type 1 TsaB [Acidobacteriota bacterium]